MDARRRLAIYQLISNEQKTTLFSGEVDAISHLTGDLANMVVSGEFREIASPAPDSEYMNGGVTITFTATEFAQNYPNTTKEVLELKNRTQAQLLATGKYKVIFDLTAAPETLSPINNEYPDVLTVHRNVAEKNAGGRSRLHQAPTPRGRIG